MGAEIIDAALLQEYEIWLYESEKSALTIKKYLHYLKEFERFMAGEPLSKSAVLRWKGELRTRIAPSTVNGALAAVNSLLRYMGREDCTVRFLKIRRRMFDSGQKELTKDDYRRLVTAAQENGNERLALLLQTVCSTGIRISELSYITVEAVAAHSVEVECKGKIRQVLLPGRLCRLLAEYAAKRNIRSGMIFVTCSGKKLDRSNIWREMKQLAREAGVAEEKVFPHNLRHLFARSFYNQEKDLLRLADILGHSSINTTRIYTIDSGKNHIRQIENLDLLVPSYNRITLML